MDALKKMNKSQKNASARLIMERGQELLFAGENHISLILGLVATIASSTAPIFICGMLYPFLTDDEYFLSMLALAFIIAAPFSVGLMRMSSLAADGKHIKFYEVFGFFSSPKRYLKSLAIAAVPTVGLLLMIIMNALAVRSLFGEVFDDALTSYMVSAVLFLLDIPLLWLSLRMCAFPMLASTGVGFFRAVALSIKLTKGKLSKILKLMVSYLPLVLISAVAVLIPMLIYTLPLLLCVYALGTNKLKENNDIEIKR